MNYKPFILLMIAGTTVAAISWLLVIFNFDPEQIGFVGFFLFYFSLFLALSGLFFLAADTFGARVNGRQLPYVRVRNTFRHAILFAILIFFWAILKSSGLLRWWNLLILVAILTITEFFFISTSREKNREQLIHYSALPPKDDGDPIDNLHEVQELNENL